MTSFHKFLFPILDTLFRNNHVFHITAGLVLGIGCGLFPFGTLQWVMSIVATIVIRSNLLALLTSLTASLVLAESLTVVWNSIGFRLLTHYSDLYPIWGWMRHAPLIPYTGFNNTVILGQTVVGIFLSIFLAIGFVTFSKSICHRLSALWYRTKASRIHAHYRRT